MRTLIVHPWAPICDARSRVLILGSFPSPASRERGFYYGHPQNVFWQTLARVLEAPPPAAQSASKTAFLLEHRIALWDALHSCTISGASDASIANAVPNRFRALLAHTQISAVFTTGKKATALFNALCAEESGARAVYLPSTSPANRAQHATPAFLEAWNQVRDALGDGRRLG
ncbi:MAG: DNA-deoxyinosine glycosylase [Spirochaetaceae bacterium]|jgi:hypoxanthine-DNA glycosylase|nr:DNA-deoxyinosine glycosylase [Spirochaetaceae bacterium]